MNLLHKDSGVPVVSKTCKNSSELNKNIRLRIIYKLLRKQKPLIVRFLNFENRAGGGNLGRGNRGGGATVGEGHPGK